jgi:general secretion pathway protein G
MKKVSIAVLLTFCTALIVVVAVLAVFAPRVVTHCGDIRRTKAIADVVGISEALELFRREQGSLPTTGEGLRTLAERSSPPMKDGYLWEVPTDPWGHPYQYWTDGQTFSVVSFGADASEGGDGQDADIESGAILANWPNFTVPADAAKRPPRG